MDVKIYCSRNNDYVDVSGSLDTIIAANFESCFRLADDRLLVVSDDMTSIYDDCILIGMEEIE